MLLETSPLTRCARSADSCGALYQISNPSSFPRTRISNPSFFPRTRISNPRAFHSLYVYLTYSRFQATPPSRGLGCLLFLNPNSILFSLPSRRRLSSNPPPFPSRASFPCRSFLSNALHSRILLLSLSTWILPLSAFSSPAAAFLSFPAPAPSLLYFRFSSVRFPSFPLCLIFSSINFPCFPTQPNAFPSTPSSPKADFLSLSTWIHFLFVLCSSASESSCPGVLFSNRGNRHRRAERAQRVSPTELSRPLFSTPQLPLPPTPL